MENQEKLVLSQSKIQTKPKGYTFNPDIIQGQENNMLFRVQCYKHRTMERTVL